MSAEIIRIQMEMVNVLFVEMSYKIWKTDTILEEQDRILMLWLENYHKSD